MKRRITTALVSALLLSACDATSNTSFRAATFVGTEDSALLIDAKQRAILTRAWKEQGQGKDKVKIRRFCSEPSPDFVSVMAQSLSAGGSFGKSADPASLQAALNLAYSRSENGTTIARTQTINMLRELMFRTCERFLSGGYDEMELSIQAVRDQRLMVSILAIEQLTGAVSPSPVVINASGSSGAGLGGEAIKTYATLRDEKKKADSAFAAAVKARDEKLGNGDDGKPRECQVIKDEQAKVPPGNVDLKTKAACEKLEKAVTDTKAAAEEVGKAFSTVEQAMTTGGVSASTVSEAIAAGGLNRATSDATKDVAATVEKIVERNFNDQTETMLYCLRTLRNLPELKAKLGIDGGRLDPLFDRCLAYIEKDVATATAISEANRLEAAQRQAEASLRLRETQEALVRQISARSKRFADFLRLVIDDQSPEGYSRDRVRKAAKSLRDAHPDMADSDGRALDALLNANSLEALESAFGALNNAYENELVGYAG
jgi:hypothetical protein